MDKQEQQVSVDDVRSFISGIEEDMARGWTAEAFALKLARIALASLEAEPVVEITHDGPMNFCHWFKGIGDLPDGCKLYEAPPAPVDWAVLVPDAIAYSDLDASSHDREVVEAIAECKGWNACRAEMLRRIEGKGKC